MTLMLLGSVTAQAGTQYNNIYVTANIESHLPEFLAMEMTKDIRESIVEYNLNRNNPEFFAARITDPKVLKLFNRSTRKIALPEIKQKNELYWMIQAGKDTIEFNSELFLKKRFYLNGQAKTLEAEDLIATGASSIRFPFFNLIIAEAVAQSDEDEEFNNAYKNLDTTKVLMAAIIALDSSFKSRGVLDKIPMMNDVADINAKNLVKKIEGYNAQCEENLQAQNAMMKAPNSDWNNLGSMDRYSMMRALRDTADPAYQNTLALIRKMAAENAGSSYERDKKLEGTFIAEKKANSCEAMLKNVFEESKNKANKLSYLIDGGNSAKVAAANHPCTKMAQLKVCLSRFATQASSINDFVRRRNGEAKEAGVQTYDVPRNYPSENTSR